MKHFTTNYNSRKKKEYPKYAMQLYELQKNMEYEDQSVASAQRNTYTHKEHSCIIHKIIQKTNFIFLFLFTLLLLLICCFYYEKRRSTKEREGTIEGMMSGI
jgi:hypothetical protein